MSTIQQSRRKQRFQLPHPNIAKVIDISKCSIPKIQISPEKYQKIKTHLICRQQQTQTQLLTKITQLTTRIQLMSKSLSYYSTENQIKQLNSQLQFLKQQENRITLSISQCQQVEKNSTSQEYFLFKKKQRIDSYHQTIDQLYEFIESQRQTIKINTINVSDQINGLKKEIERIQKYNQNINSKSLQQHQQQLSPFPHLPKQEQQSRISFEIDEDLCSQVNFEGLNNQIRDSDSQSSLQTHEEEQFNVLRQQYQSLQDTVDILSENKQILTAQLFNGIQTIQQRINQYFENQKTKMFRDITQNKQDLQNSMRKSLPGLIDTELNYNVQPLIDQYKSRLQEIGKKLSPDLKSITSEIIQPLKWQSIIKFDDHLQMSQQKSRRLEQLRQSNVKRQYQTLQTQLKQQNEEIKKLQQNLQQLMGQMMVYKQKEHQVELAMNNMRKVLRESQKP